jgi:L-fuconolactonase
VIGAVIGWASLADAALPHRLDRWMAAPAFRGLRTLPAFGEEAWQAAAARDNLHALAERGLVLEVLAQPAQLDAVARLQEAAPGLTLVLNHCGRPLTATGETAAWAPALRRLAQATPIACKLSSLAERAGMDWDLARLQPFLDVTLAAFGPARLAFGSNWPVVEIASSYRGWWQALEAMLAPHGLDAAARAEIFGGTAAKVYRLEQIAGERARSEA